MSKMLNVSTSPHVRSSVSTASIMRDVAIALIPASLFGIYNFGLNALLIIAVCIAASVLTEYIYESLMKLPITTGDWSAVVTGLLLALNLPSTVPIWIPIIGSVFAILVVKQIFGGLGQNFMNPALGARCFLLISFAGRMTNYAYDKAVGFTRFMSGSDFDAITSSTPLAVMKNADKAVGVADALAAGANGTTVMDMFIGTIGGTIGETSVIALLIGAIYLLAKKIISLRIPLVYIATFAVFVLLFGGRGMDL
ncbi:MAG: RnfABCDGE type electron transport complex subunit D, partial [Clostridiales bacterium]|nr:RnfABCDGE type electron transport complex subunit D [Clostridiales bacterium]